MAEGGLVRCLRGERSSPRVCGQERYGQVRKDLDRASGERMHNHAERMVQLMRKRQIWGFATIDGEKRHVRRLHFTGPEGQIIQARIVYDYREMFSI